MLTLNDPRIPQTYEQANNLMGDRDDMNVAHNTRLERGDTDIYVIFHNTCIVTYHPDDTVTLNSGGWQTVTTKQRMNLFTNLSINQKDYVWYVTEPTRSDDRRMVWFGEPDDDERTMEFSDRDRYANTPEARKVNSNA